MRRHAFTLAALLVVALLALTACGGKKKSEGSSGGGGGGSSDVSGAVRVVGVWTGAEQQHFQAVLNGFKEKYPNV